MTLRGAPWITVHQLSRRDLYQPMSTCAFAGYLRDSQAMIDTNALSNSMVVTGKKNLKPGRSMTMSPGRRNSGSALTQDHARPSRIRIAPRPTSKRFIGEVYSPCSTIATP